MRCLLLALAAALPLAFAADASKLCFPDGFLFGTATASYQVEGGWNEAGRTPSIWDDFCRKEPSVACANVADDFFHRYKEDIQMMREAGHNAFRFSISWSRVMNWDPTTKRMKPNAPGIAFYHSLIDELNANGVAPVLTIYHWDLPIELQTQLSPPSWLNPAIQDHYIEYSELLFKEYGKKVEFWTTFNEPWAFVAFGYGTSGLPLKFAPGPKPSATNQYIAGHNVLLAHGKVVKRFRELKDQKVINSKARIAIVMTGDHNTPLDPSNPDDVEAAERTYQFNLGWFLEPTISGDYPAVMRKRVGDRLPKFTAEESALMKGSYDIFNLNHYGTHMVTDCSSPRSKVRCEDLAPGYMRDLGVDNTQPPKGAYVSTMNPFFSSYPEGYRGIIRWMHEHNKTTPILLTENGFCGGKDEELEDPKRVWYHQSYLEYAHKAITEDKIPIIGYTAWSLLDNYEWGSFKPRFGLYHVNYTSQAGAKESWSPKPGDLARTPRLVAKWYASLAQTGCMAPWQEGEKIPEIVPVTLASHGWSAWWIGAIVVAMIAVVVFAVVSVRRRRGYNRL